MMVEHFKQTPRQLGFTEDDSESLLRRCLDALQVYELSKRLAQNPDSVSYDEWLSIEPLQKALDKVIH
jgi:hypothetical protein